MGVTLSDRILELLGSGAALDDDEIASRLGVVRQQVNQACRRLAARGALVRGAGPGGKLVNRAAGSRAPTPATSPPATTQPDWPITEDEVKEAVAEVRKVVTAVFCDLVGFTATSESADPEDADEMLATYFAMARGKIEAHGGVVEKFIGDAVVGVVGVPAAHEDDPERAVRAGLRICEDDEDLTSAGEHR